jgi:Ca2+-binding EF-hand superfamily protein
MLYPYDAQVLLNIDQNKLVALAFMMADADGNNVLTRREMMSFLTNFMQVLVAINSQTTAEATSTQNRHQIQQGSERLTNTFFEAAGICGDSISFEQFQEVVKVHPVPWLSALDVLLSHGLKEDAKRLEVAKGRVGSVRRSSQIVSIPIDDSGDTLELKTYDLAKFSALCGYLRDLTQDQLVKVFYEHSDNGELSRDSFNKCISQLFPVKDQATGETVASHLSLMFNVFSHHKLGKAINLDEFLSGLRLFCTGSNEDKIMFAFTMIDSDGDGHIALWELIKFFRSLFTMLVTVSGLSQDIPLAPLGNLLNKAAKEKAKQFFVVADTDQDGRISFQEFISVPDVEKAELFSWLGLFDLTDYEDGQLSQTSERSSFVATDILKKAPSAASNPPSEFASVASVSARSSVSLSDRLYDRKHSDQVNSWC